MLNEKRGAEDRYNSGEDLDVGRVVCLSDTAGKYLSEEPAGVFERSDRKTDQRGDQNDNVACGINKEELEDSASPRA